MNFRKFPSLERRFLFWLQNRNKTSSAGKTKKIDSTGGSVKLSYNSYNYTQAKTEVKSPLVILHGLFGSKVNWHSIAKAIPQRTGRKVFTVDARNHGESPHVPLHTYDLMRDDICSLLEELSIKKCVLVGHSMGGRTAMNLALSEPAFIDKLVIVDITPFQTPNNLQMIKYAQAMRSIKFAQGVPLSKVRKETKLLLESLVEDERVRQFLVSSIIDIGNGAFKWQFNIEGLCDNLPNILNPQQFTTKFSGPTLFIRGGNSDYVKVNDQIAIREKFFPNAIFHSIPDAGHFVHSEKPVEFLDILCRFVNDNMSE